MKMQAPSKRDHWETDYGSWAKKPEWSSRGLAEAPRDAVKARRSSPWRFLILATGLVAAVSATLIGAD